MATQCSGICNRFRTSSIQLKYKYQNGQKRCTFCGIFLKITKDRCPCCGTLLRTRSRHRKKTA